ncbi:MAG: tetratricopeptide repeat protein [Spirochaetes bacterium]|nr:tetratricopeptide repeat protein [Spirochaetota bacterium]
MGSKTFRAAFVAALLLGGLIHGQGADTGLCAVAVRAFNDGSWQFALTRFRKLAEDYPQSPLRPSALYYGGLCSLYLEDTARARAVFDELARTYPNDPFTAKSRIHLCRILLDGGKPAAAVEEGRSALQRFKLGDREGELRLVIAQGYFRLGAEEAALKELSAIAGPARDAARFELASWHFRKGRFAESEAILAELGARLPAAGTNREASPEPELRQKALFWLAKSVFHQRRFDEAAQRFDAVLGEGLDALSPMAQEARFLKAYLPYEKGAYSNAVQSLSAFVDGEEGSPFAPDARYFLARAREETGQEVLALAAYQDFAAGGPTNRYYADALQRAVRLYARRGDETRFSAALSNLEAAGKTSKDEVALRELATFFLDRDPARAEHWYRRLLANGAKSIESLKGLSYALLKQGRSDEANQTLRQAAEASKEPAEKAELLMLVAENHYEERKWEEAAQAFRKVADAFPDLPRAEDARDGLAWSLFQKKEYDKAWSAWSDARRARDPKLRRSAWFGMAESSRFGGNAERALEEYDAFAKNFPEDRRAVTARQRAAKILYDRREYARAFTQFSLLREQAGAPADRIHAVYWMAWCRLQDKNEEEAISFFRSLPSLDPRWEDARTADGALVAAKLLLSKKQDAEARGVWERLVAVLPTASNTNMGALKEAWYQLMVLANLQDRETDADFCFGKLADLGSGPSDGALLYTAAGAVADRAYEKQRWERAAAWYGKSLAHATASRDKRLATFWLGVSQKQGGKLEEARDTLTGLVAAGADGGKNEFYWQGLIELAETEARLGNLPRAEQAWRLISSSAPDEGLRQRARESLSVRSVNSERGQVSAETNAAKLVEMAQRLSDAEAKAMALLKLGQEAAKRPSQAQKASEYLKEAANLSTGETGAKAQRSLVKLLFQAQQFEVAWQEGMAYLYQYDRYREGMDELLWMTSEAAGKAGQKKDAKRLADRLRKDHPSSPFIARLTGS